MPSHGCSTSKESDESAEPDYGERLHVREERRLDEPAVDEGVRAVGEPDGHEPAQHPFDRSLQQERAADGGGDVVGAPPVSVMGAPGAALQPAFSVLFLVVNRPPPPTPPPTPAP